MVRKTSHKTAEPDPGREPSPARISEIAAKSREVAKRLPVVGHVTWLCSQSQSHRQMFIQDLEWRVFPPIMLGQYKLHTDSKVGGLPTAYASWAFLSKEAESIYRDTHKLRPGDWRSGDCPWLVDFIIPFGGASPLLEELHYQIHKERELRLLYPGSNSTPVETTLSELIRWQSSDDTSPASGDSDDKPVQH